MSTENLIAHRLNMHIAPAPNWPTETWVIRESDMTPIAQVELYWYARDRQWHLWTCSIVSRDVKRLGMRLQDARNANDSEPETLTLE